jgi:hypothetical protein
MNWIDLTSYSNANEFLMNLKSQTRRNIRISQKSLEIEPDSFEHKLSEAYSLIELNAAVAGYHVRKWRDVKTSFKNLLLKNYLSVELAQANNVSKGSSIFFKNKYYFSYSMGGTIKQKPDLKTGYFLHWKAIEKSFDANYKGYNISMGGSKGVKRFKANFGAESIRFDDPHHTFVLNSFKYKLFLLFNSKLKPLKQNISRLLKMFN